MAAIFAHVANPAFLIASAAKHITGLITGRMQKGGLG
jgi:hypothetical protein